MRARRLTIAAFLLVTAAPAMATVITLDFNTVMRPDSNALSTTLGNTGSSTNIQNWLTAKLPGAGATITGALATATYDGEGKVINGLTLGTSDGGISHPGHDTFIMNDGFGTYGKSDFFTITFPKFKVSSVSFDWEIFPDVSCAKGSTCAGGLPGIISLNNPWPDIELWVDGSTKPFWSAVASPSANPQGLGNSGTLYIPGGTHMLKFMDWPAEVGIDNFKFSTVPEPSPLALVGLALALLALVQWRVQRGVGSTLTGSTAL